MTEIAALKNALRQDARRRLAGLGPGYIGQASCLIALAVLAHPLYRQADSVFMYVSLPREPDTHDLIRAALVSGKRVYVPRCREKPRMEAVEIRSLDQLRPGMLGILEPPPSLPADECPSLSLAIVPCVSAGRDGRRLGHGGGYYDAFLRGRGIPALCLCFDQMIRDDIPMCEGDIWMTQVITENG